LLCLDVNGCIFVVIPVILFSAVNREACFIEAENYAQVDDELIKDIRLSVNKGLAL
jgi:hypothetical protein